MADAKALFARHVKGYNDMMGTLVAGHPDSMAIIYAACILAEAIRNDVYDEPFRVIEPKVLDAKEPNPA